MKCPICEALHRDHSRECQLEAETILQQRFELLSPVHAKTRAAEQETESIVLNSRKRQMEIASRLDLHKTTHHAA